MSEQLDYINLSIQKARVTKIDRFVSGAYVNLPHNSVHYDAGYLQALDDVEQFQRDYIELKNPAKPEKDDGEE